MARTWNRLTANAVRGASKGRYSDGGNLYLQVAEGDSKSWLFIFRRDGLRREMGLGSVRSVPLALARELATQCREQLARNLDPIDARKAAAQEQRAARARLQTFRQAAEQYHRDNLTRWRSAKHKSEWLSPLRRFAFPLIGHLGVATLDPNHVCRVLQPLVATKPVTAARLRGRIEVVLDAATAGGRRSGENPAAKHLIGNLLPLRSEKASVTHQPALPFVKLPALMRHLRPTPGMTARLLELIVLTGLRSDAVRLARFSEFDLAAAIWVVPKDRTKSLGKDHRVPLGPRAVEIVKELRADTHGDLLFPSAFGDDSPIGKNEPQKLLVKLLKQIGHDQHAVVHGFRATFKTWCHETRDYPAQAIEQALGHAIRGSVEKAYRRGDLFDRRKLLMADWERFCSGAEVDTVVKLRA
jgi:integrase